MTARGFSLAGSFAALFGRFGLAVPLAALALGFAAPPLAAMGRDLLPLCIVLVLGTGVLLTEPGRLRVAELLRPLALVGVNLLCAAILACLPPLLSGSAGIWPWVVLAAAAPPAGSAALMAGMLGLPVRPVLFAQLAGFLALPLTAPLVALLLPELALDPARLAARISLLVGLPCLGAPLLRWLLGPARRQELAPRIQTLGILALSGIALGTAAGLGNPPPSLEPGEALLALGLVLLLGAGLGAMVGAGATGGTMPGFALAGGVRNLSVLWGACVGLVPPAAELLLQCGTLITLATPSLLALGLGVARLGRMRSGREGVS